MSVRRARALLAVAVLLAVAGGAAASLRIFTSKGVAVRWKTSTLEFVVQADGSDDLPGDDDDLAVRRAFAAWADEPAVPLLLVEDAAPDSRARTDWPSDDLHSVIFAEDGDDLLFPEGSGFVAVTPLQYVVSSGKLLDADIVLNGRDVHFATAPAANAFDVRAIVTHEVGHLLGLDHSAQGSATMTPYAHPGFVLPRTLSDDERAGLVSLGGDDGRGRLVGSVLRAASGSPVSGAHVWARSSADGRLASAALTDADGAYELRALAPGSYVLAVAPLDGPLTVPAITAGTGLPPFETDFLPLAASAFAYTLVGDETVAAAPLVVGDDVSLRIGAPFTARVVHPGETVPLVVTVQSFVAPGSVVFAGAGDALVVGEVEFVPATGRLLFDVTAADDAPPGAYDLVVHSAAGGLALAAGLLEVAPALPVPSALQPACGPASGGVLATLFGSSLDGVVEATLGGVVVPELLADASLLDLVTPATSPGSLELLLLTSAGEELRLPEAYEARPAAVPQIGSLFPAAGSSSGGTQLVLLGGGFDADTLVFLGGVPAPTTLVDATRLDVLAPALPPGAHALRVEHAGCAAMASEQADAYHAVAGDDPLLVDATPALVAHTGGELVTLLGAGFVEGSTVELGASTLDGSGGVPVPTEYVDASTLRFVTPPAPLGAASLLVRLPDGRVAELPDALTVIALLDGKDKLLGDLAPQDEDLVFVDLVAGTRLSATLRRRGEGSLVPVLALRAPGGETLVSTDANDPAFDPVLTSSSSKRAKLSGVVVERSGRHALALGGADGSAGGYRLTLSEKLPPIAKGLKLPGGSPAPGPGGIALDLEVKAGSLLSGKLVGKQGLQIVLVSLEGPQGVLLSGDETGALSGAPELVAAVTRSADGSRLVFKKLPLVEFGAYTLTLGAVPGSDGTLGGKLSVKAPQTKLVLEE
ncbi:MAG: IPT/TIG domain-containing protein [Planctomycetes bacterium]|nr:IPT/TIG domain-containing protein [Planctomycetota bacterium]